MNHVVVYSTDQCMDCRMTLRALARSGLNYEVVDLDAAPAAVALVKALGFTAVPVVSTGDRWWAGYRPDLLHQIEDR